MDVTKHDQILAAYEQVKRIIPPDTGLWALDNNAGYMTLAPVEWFTLDEYKRMADVNLWGLIDVTKTFLPLLKKAKGRIINMSSIIGLFCGPFASAYGITKYGVEAFSDALRRELSPWEVNVSIVEPQAFKTPLLDNILPKISALWDRLSPELQEDYGEEYRDVGIKAVGEYLNREASTHTAMVIDTLIDAITSQHPKPRYQVGFGAKQIVVLSSLPTSWADLASRMVYRLAKPKGAQNC